MKNIIILIFLSLIFLSVQSQVNSNLILNNLLEKIDSSNTLMGNISISKAGKEVYKYSLGYRNLDENLRNTDKTKFRIGSISKSFTAVMIMQLIEEKKLSLTSKLASFLPEIPNSKIVSIEQLLKHQSGLFNITESPNFFTWMESYHSKEEVISLVVANGTVFKPGKKTQYSNTNYILLSYILEQIEKKDYSQILLDRISKPCKLKNTYFATSTNKNEALSYHMDSAEWLNTTITDASVPMGAGGIVSTPIDLNSFYFQLFNGDLLNQNSLNIMTSNNNLYEFALYPVISYESKVCFGHEGRIDGFHSYSVYFPKDSTGISICANGDVGYLKDILLQTLYSFNQINDAKRIYVKKDNKIELIKLNNILLVKINNGQYFIIEKSKKNVYKSAKNNFIIKINNDRIILKIDKEKTTFQRK